MIGSGGSPLGWTWHAMAQANAAISRATAVVTKFAFLPAATSRRKRAQSRSCAFQAIALAPLPAHRPGVPGSGS
jgi:hypothetical protein